MHFRYALGLSLMLSSLPVLADADSEKVVAVPDKVSANILKRHANAQELQASYENHFGVKLLEVAFKSDGGEPLQELFTLSGHLFTNERLMENLSGISAAALATLQQHFPNYQLKKAEMVTNPNGVGEEYEVYLHSGGSDWKVLLDDKGTLLQKEPLS